MRQVLCVVRYNFRGFFKNPKVILTILLGIVLCYLLTARIMIVVNGGGTPVQLTEPFLWTFGDAPSILLSSVLLLLLLSDLPLFGSMTPYYLCRMTRKKWLLGQMLYAVFVAFAYTAFLFVATVMLCVKTSYLGNRWSETAAMLAYSKLGKELSVPSSVKVMESITPYGCALKMLCLLFCYILVLSFLVLAGNLAGQGRGMAAGLLFCLYGFLLEPKTLASILHVNAESMYKVNVLLGWISPLSHAVYAKHSFGYDKMPKIYESCILFVIIAGLLGVVSMKRLKQYNFVFLGERS